jgi:hypothetical protein
VVTFSVKVDPAAGIVHSKADIRNNLYRTLEGAAKVSAGGSRQASQIRKYALHSKDGALVAVEKPALELESAPADSIDALRKLAEFFLP